MKQNVPASSLTTLGVGGPIAHVSDNITDALEIANHKNIPLFVLGGGSNILISDSGLVGVALQVAADAIEQQGDLLMTDAGCPWDTLVAYAVSRNLAGVECLSGIPGTVGAAPVQNIGAYGQQVGDVVRYVEAVDRTTGLPVRLEARECAFGYRSSIFNTRDAGRYIITQVALSLVPDGKATVTYADLAHLAPGASLSEVRDAVLNIRERKGMLALEGRRRHRSAGSFFKNPVVASPPDGIRAWPTADSRWKLSAAALIEASGITRGFTMGAAAVSPDHALSIITTPGATSADVVALARHMQASVRDFFGITLEPEVQLWGFDEYPLIS